MKRFKKIISLTLSMALTATSLITPSLFTSAEDNVRKSADDSELAASSALGSTLMGLIDEQKSEDEGADGAGCYISGVQFDAASKTAAVSSVQNIDCCLTVGLYSDDGTVLLESKTVDITSDSKENYVTFTAELPEFYLVKAFLTDSLQRPLCKARAYEDGTQEIQTIKAATINDFDQSLVINLDESSETNFLVLNENAVKAVSDDTVNTLVSEDIENGVYTFDNIDDTVRGLESGDILCVQPSEDDMIAVVVDSAVIDGDSAEITADSEKASQIFDFIKIEADSTGAEPTVDMSGATEGVVAVDDPGEDFFKEYEDKINSADEVSDAENDDTVSAADEASLESTSLKSTNLRGGFGDIDVGGSDEVSQSFSIGLNLATQDRDGFDLSMSSSITFSAEISFTFYHDTVFFGADYNYLDFRIEQSTEEGFSIELGFGDDIKEILKKAPKNDDINIGRLSIPLGPTGLDVAFEIKLVYSIKGALTFTETKSSVSGITYSTDEGWNEVKEDSDPEVSAKAEGEFSIGIEIGVSLEVFEGVVSAGASVTFGITISASVESHNGSDIYPTVNAITSDKTDDNLHLCAWCIDGDITFDLDISIEASILFDLFGTELSLFKYSVNIGDFFWNKHDYFGLGECPNQFSKVTVNVVDENGRRVSGADVSIGSASLKTDSNGKAVFYVRDGANETITAKFGGDTSTLQIAVRGNALNKTISVIDDVSGKASASTKFEGHTYQIFESGLVWADAESYCESLGGHLAVITSAEEQAAIEELLAYGTKNSYWIGAENSKGSWEWVTGEDFEYTNWASNQPDNAGRENALMIYTAVNPMNRAGSGFGTWNDLKDDCTCGKEEFFGTNNFGFVCEWEDSDDAAVVTTTTVTTTTTAAVTTTTVNIDDIVYRAAAKPVTVDGVTSFTFDTAVPGTEYLLAACTNADDVFGSLVYIDQRTADEDGSVTFTFAEPTSEVTYVFVGDLGRGDYCRTSGDLDIENEVCTICGHAVSDIIASAGILTGDVNGDSYVDSSDAALILREYALVQAEEAATFTEVMMIVADYNDDGAIDSSDSALILKAYADSQAG